MNDLTHLPAARVLSLFKIQADRLQGAASEAANVVARLTQEIAQETEQDRIERAQLGELEQAAAALALRVNERVGRLETLQEQRQASELEAGDLLAQANAADAFIKREYGRLRAEQPGGQPVAGQAPPAQNGGAER